MVFAALTEPPVDASLTGSRWYVVRQAEILHAPDGSLPVGADATTPPGALGALAPDTAAVFLGVADGVACWALGVPAGAEPPDGWRFEALMVLGSLLDVAEWSVAGRAVQLVEWARTSRFCGRCATATVGSPGERAMRCPACGLLAYPRLAPAVIVAVHRGEEVLLARNGRFRGRMFSTVAGFVEPGETLEECVHREVGEEVGVRLGALRYVASQPWPFPHSLMVGYLAEWAGGEIVVDGDEIVEAAWFRHDALPEVPPPLSIARRLIDLWRAEVAG